MSAHNEVLVIGAGPAGLAAAIACCKCGLQTTILDARLPPIDKACGEGLLPGGVHALRALGIHLNPDAALPFAGIQFLDEESSACARFVGTPGYSLRRVRLHDILVEHAIHAGVNFRWGARVEEIHPGYVQVEKTRIPYDWLVGADGQNSIVRKWAKLPFHAVTARRFAFRKHFQVLPWTDVVEVYWTEGVQLVVTPTGMQEVGVAVISRDSRLRVEQALPHFPGLARRLDGASSTSKELGDVTLLTRLPAVTADHVALIGDASGTMDAVTGEGLSLSFQQALHLARAFRESDLGPYEISHQKISAIPALMTRLLLVMDGNDWVRRRILRLLQNKPALFSKLMSIHTGTEPVSSIKVSELADFGWNFLWA